MFESSQQKKKKSSYLPTMYLYLKEGRTKIPIGDLDQNQQEAETNLKIMMVLCLGSELISFE